MDGGHKTGFITSSTWQSARRDRHGGDVLLLKVRLRLNALQNCQTTKQLIDRLLNQT